MIELMAENYGTLHKELVETVVDLKKNFFGSKQSKVYFEKLG